MKYDPIKSLNKEVERKLWTPIILGVVIVLLLVPAMIATLLYFKEEIDAFSMKHPVLLAICFLVPGTWGWVVYGRRNNLW
jgi:flagellar basal body-associated protein FliL